MRDIEELLELSSKQDVKIPLKIEYRIQNTLKHKHKKQWKNYIKKFVTIMASIMVVFVGSISVYAAFGGTIGGKPVLEWIGIRFSDEYENYKVNVEGQEVAYNETKIDLVSTVCDEGFTILEFDVKLSKQDKEYLRLGESIITEEDIQQAKEIDEEQFNETGKTPAYNHLMEAKDTLNTVALIFFGQEQEEYGKIVYNPERTYNVIIDGEEMWTKTTQTVTKISDYEYKVYQLFLLTEDELEGKENFKISLNRVVLGNTGEKKKTESGMQTINTANNARYINIGGEFEVEVSKEKALQNTNVIYPENAEVTYKKMTQKIEEVKVTPLQIIAKVSTTINDVSLQSLSSSWNEDHIGLIDFKVYDNNNQELSSCQYETKRVITYENWKTEEWATGDIGTFKDFENATMYLTEYIIIEKKEDVDSIKIVPVEKNITDNGEEENTLGEMQVDIN